MTDKDAAALKRRLEKAANKWKNFRSGGKPSGRRKPNKFPPKTEPPYGNRAKPVSDRRHVPRTSAAGKSVRAAAETEKLYEQSRKVRTGKNSAKRIKELEKLIASETNKAKAHAKSWKPDMKSLDAKAKELRAKIEATKKPNTRVNPNRPKAGSFRDKAFRKARAEGRVRPRPAGHPNAPRSNPNLGKIKVPTVHGEIQKASGAIQKVGSATAKSAVRSNSLLSRVARGATSVAKTAGKGLMALADSGPGARLAAKVGAKVAGRVLVPLGLAADAVAIAGAGTEGVRALKAQHDARKEKQGSEAKYGTVEAATRTRHARRDARRKAAADRAGGPKVNV